MCDAPVLPFRYVANRFEDVVWINGHEDQVCCKPQIYHWSIVYLYTTLERACAFRMRTFNEFAYRKFVSRSQFLFLSPRFLTNECMGTVFICDRYRQQLCLRQYSDTTGCATGVWFPAGEAVFLIATRADKCWAPRSQFSKWFQGTFLRCKADGVCR